ncbi:response regulator [candidate division KSB1 bacterium]|nr:response regulator [candidate division KSB1 bacterium]
MKRILVVDDNKNFLFSLSLGLKRNGYAVESCTNAFRALELLDGQSFDVLLTDLKMADMNGLELARRANNCDEHLHIILMTAYDINDYKDTGRIGSKIQHLSKPFELSMLVSMLSWGDPVYSQHTGASTVNGK